jgi:CRISPR system Cascade subunit CasC
MSNDTTIAGKKFLQLHLLTTHLPSNLNRDNLGRPKTAMFGNATRGRISSQSIKYAWRNSNFFQSCFKGMLSIRTRSMWESVYDALLSGDKLEETLKPDFVMPEKMTGVEKDKALAWTLCIRGDEKEKDEEDMAGSDDNTEQNEAQDVKAKGKGKKGGDQPKKPTVADLKEKTVSAFTPAEVQRLSKIITTLLEKKTLPEKIDSWRQYPDTSAVDIALFGRMLASSAKHNCDGAVQLSHIITVNPAPVEDDYFTAVDELNKAEQMGAAHVNVAQFLSGLYYCHIVVDLHQLVNNLGGHKEGLPENVIEAFVKSAATVSPRGKQHPMSSEGPAVYLRAEVGDQIPRHLGVAFLKPIRTEDLLEKTVKRLTDTVDSINRVYGQTYDDSRQMILEEKDSHTLQDIIDFAKEAIRTAPVKEV